MPESIPTPEAIGAALLTSIGVTRLLGHASLATTQDYYANLPDDAPAPARFLKDVLVGDMDRLNEHWNLSVIDRAVADTTDRLLFPPDPT